MYVKGVEGLRTTMLCGEIQNVHTNSAHKYTHFCPARNHPGTLKVTQSANKSHGLYDVYIMNSTLCVCLGTGTGSLDWPLFPLHVHSCVTTSTTPKHWTVRDQIKKNYWWISCVEDVQTIDFNFIYPIFPKPTLTFWYRLFNLRCTCRCTNQFSTRISFKLWYPVTAKKKKSLIKIPEKNIVH